MNSQVLKPKNINEYILATPLQVQDKLLQMVKTIRSAAPRAEEGLKWGMPAFSYDRILVTFAAHKNHIGFYPTPSALEAFKKELSKYITAKGSVQFTLDKPLPLSLVSAITKFRVKESKEKDVKWKPAKKATK
ncbi:MAG: DUF1801 domain-containing protein [Ginsengibacter sp.]